MAAVIGDLVPDVSRFCDMLVNPSSMQQGHQHQQHQHQQHQHPHQQHPHQHQHQHPPRHRGSLSQTNEAAAAASCSPRRSTTRPTPATPPTRPHYRHEDAHLAQDKPAADSDAVKAQPQLTSACASSPRRGHDRDDVAFAAGRQRIPSRIPSPPPSSSPASSPAAATAAASSAVHSEANDEQSLSSMASQMHDAPRPLPPSHSASLTASPRRHQLPQQPSPPADDFQIQNSTRGHGAAPQTSTAEPSLAQDPVEQPHVIHVRDLAHIQELAAAHSLGAEGLGAADAIHTKYEISGMPMSDIIEMVAALLTKITTTNDLQHDAMQRNVAHQQQANQTSDAAGKSHISPLSHSVLAFHGKNVPAITILSYLSRIHKYCPTTFEVFLSLLVYFDRMTERVNDLVMKSEAAASQPVIQTPSQQDIAMEDDISAVPDADESDSDLADDDDNHDAADDSTRPETQGRDAASEMQPSASGPVACFVVDSFNIHRLIIAGVTCASKFFSDVFYTNSRYAKVGGLPLAELNLLEIQFLVLNDFRLAVPVEDLEAYATMLVEFYAREVISQKPEEEHSEA
ncbi:hypothetical protein HIM_07587 [Hirsutella minnesotensis 3608]|uniref:Cyclin-domain-containing protein n=1 Tax=Hirsutella minnesotensis 3608 TaxID=1043627 RepID=A0A0F7ZN26_9HYPO|nr:hypothetical protein HIM_07587 [Hirsutella minnesotensis 3608]